MAYYQSIKRFSLSSLHGIPSLFVHGETTRSNEESESSTNLSNQYGEKQTTWYSGECTTKSNVPSFVKLPKAHTITVIPGYVRVLNSGSSNPEESAKPEARMIEINSQLSFICSKTEVTLKYPQAESLGGVEKTYIFSTPAEATSFISAIQQELDRSYIHSDVFETLNARIRERISAGDLPLRVVYYAGLSDNTPRKVINALYSNYRIMLGGNQGTAESFAALLSAVARDPVLLILFLCCQMELSEAMLNGFDSSTSVGSATAVKGKDTCKLILLTKLLDSLQAAVSAPKWSPSRALFLAQFQYPYCGQESSGLATAGVLRWSVNFTAAGYIKLLVNSHVLQNLLHHEKYLCYTFLRHHATHGGSCFTKLVQEVFSSVPKTYLFESFNADDVKLTGGGSEDSKPKQTNRHHFVDFLFNPNLTEDAVFETLLMAFKNSDGYNDDFFQMFLTEAFAQQAHAVAVNVLKSILFQENGEPSIQALQSCQCIPVIIFKVLVANVLTSHAEHRGVDDYMRMLLEMALSFEDYARTSSELRYMTTISALFVTEPVSIQQFTQLLEVMKFPAFVTHLCKLNLPEESAQTEGHQVQKTRSTARSVRHAKGAVHLASYDTVTMIDTSSRIVEGSLSAQGGKAKPEASAPPIATSITSEPLEISNTAVLPKASAYYGDASYVTSENLSHASYGNSKSSHRSSSAALPAAGSTPAWKIRSECNLGALVYGFMTLVIFSGTLPKLSEAAAPQNETLAAFLGAVPPSFYTVLLRSGSEMRTRLVLFLKSKFHIRNPYDCLLEEPFLLCRASHFRYSFLHALSYELKALRQLAVDLITVAVQLDQTSGLWACLHCLNNTVGASGDLQEEMWTVLNQVKTRDNADLQAACVSLQTLAEYAQIVVNIQQNQSAKQREALSSAVNLKLFSSPVSDWADWFAKLKAKGCL